MLDLQIITPDKLVLTDRVDFLVAPAVDGEVGILPGHTPLLSRLGEGELRLTKNDKIQYFAIHGGFLKVIQGNKVSVFAETAELSEEIDLERAKLAEERTKSELKGTQNLTPEKLAELEMALGRARLRVKIGSIRKKKAPRKSF